jgi:hypothetical protein
MDVRVEVVYTLDMLKVLNIVALIVLSVALIVLIAGARDFCRYLSLGPVDPLPPSIIR